MIPLDVKLDDNYFWIEQNYGCSFPFTCKNGIVNFLTEGSDRPYEELSLDSKVYRKLKERFDGKHILELYKGIKPLIGMRIKNHFVAEEFQKHDIFAFRGEPENTLDLIEQYKKWLADAKNKNYTSDIERYENEIKRLQEYINNLVTSERYINAKKKYDDAVIHKMRMLHGIVYGYKNVVDFN